MNTKQIVAIGQTAVISRALYDDLARQISACHNVLNQFGVPGEFDTLAGRVDCALRLAEQKGATWQCDDELEQDYQRTVDDLRGRY